MVSTYERLGYSKEWINRRLQAISTRKELTDELKERGVEKGVEYAILTDEITMVCGVWIVIIVLIIGYGINELFGAVIMIGIIIYIMVCL